MKKRKEKKIRFSISMDEKLLKTLDIEAKINRWSRASMITYIIENYFEVDKQ